MALQKQHRIWDFAENDHFHHNSPPPPAGVEFMAYLIIRVNYSPPTLGFCSKTPFSKKCVGIWQSQNVNIWWFEIVENICIWLYFSSATSHTVRHHAKLYTSMQSFCISASIGVLKNVFYECVVLLYNMYFNTQYTPMHTAAHITPHKSAKTNSNQCTLQYTSTYTKQY